MDSFNAIQDIKHKWVCNRCGKEIFIKPHKNATCECKGRYVHYSRCKRCGEWFKVKKNLKYCSAKCRGYKLSERRKPIELVCDYCGKTFKRYRANVNKNTGKTFCSKECKNKFYSAEKLIRTCKNCGKEFVIYKTALKTNASGHYCSKQCYWQDMQIPKKGYNGFGTAKKLYFKGTQFCAICGTTHKINIHHIIPNRLTQDQSKDNLIPLCAKHHSIVENATRKLLTIFTNYDMLKMLLNNVLRQRQIETYTTLKRIKNET